MMVARITGLPSLPMGTYVAILYIFQHCQALACAQQMLLGVVSIEQDALQARRCDKAAPGTLNCNWEAFDSNDTLFWEVQQEGIALVWEEARGPTTWRACFAWQLPSWQPAMMTSVWPKRDHSVISTRSGP